MVGSYRVERLLGEGGMGAVYELVHPGIGKRLALKLLHAEYAARPQIVQRFFDEARAVNLIHHPNIVDILDFAHLPDGRAYLTMEFLEGESLAAYIHERGALAPASQHRDGVHVQVRTRGRDSTPMPAWTLRCRLLAASMMSPSTALDVGAPPAPRP